MDDERMIFTIDSDSKAEWALEKIKEAEADAKRLLDLVEEKRAELDAKEEQINDNLKSKTMFLKAALIGYFETVKPQETKTQKTYKLLSGTLIKKKDTYRYDRDEKALLTWAKANGKEEYVETSEKVKWAELKKNLAFDGEDVYDPETGVKVDGITATLEPGKFEVKTE